MSLVVAIRAVGGIVLASDSRETSVYSYTDQARKLYRLSDFTVLGCVGDTPLYEHIVATVMHEGAIASAARLDDVARVLSEVSVREHKRLLQLPEAQKAHAGQGIQFTLVGYSDTAAGPQIIGASQKTSYQFKKATDEPPYTATGAPGESAMLLRRCANGRLALEEAKRLAALCIVETAAMNSAVGGPICMFVAHGDVVKELQAEELRDLTDFARAVDWMKLLR